MALVVVSDEARNQFQKFHINQFQHCRKETDLQKFHSKLLPTLSDNPFGTEVRKISQNWQIN